MKEGFVVDSFGYPSDLQLENINKLSRRILKKEEVYVFSVVLCDNETDRDFERFSPAALNKLAGLFIGKTGIYDHSMKSRDQVARIFDCTVEREEARFTDSGEPYVRLKALAYMPRCKSNEDMILAIDSGIKKEVSVGCAVSTKRCSVCGADISASPCNHRPGRYYNSSGVKKLCTTVLDNPTDAYEWSFVAVPAQREAGVTKSMKGAFGRRNENGIPEFLTGDGTVTLSGEQKKELCGLIKRLSDTSASNADEWAEDYKNDTLKLMAAAEPSLDRDTAEKIIAGLSRKALTRYRESLFKKLDTLYPPCGQLCPSAPKAPEENRQYRI